MSERPEIPRTVAPRKAGFRELPLIVVELKRKRVTITTTGEIVPLDRFAEWIQNDDSEGAIVAVSGAGELVARLDRDLSDDESFQWRATIVEREIVSFTDEAPLIVEEDVFSYFGFRRPNGHERGRWFHVLDPLTFFDSDLSGTELRSWAEDVISFCRDNDLPIRPTSAGIAGLLLRDRRFWPELRRKIPTATNERLRDTLPGNYYRANCLVGWPYKALYVDQVAAHHAVATELAFPHADYLYGRGFFDDDNDNDPWITPDDPEYPEIIGSPGVVRAVVSIPHRRLGPFPHPIEELGSGDHVVKIYTSEIDFLAERGIKIRHLSASWTAPIADPGLNAYARWSLDQLRAADPARLQWLKPLLLSAYGLLAARPRKLQTAYRVGSGPEVSIGATGPIGRLRTARSETQIPIANVIARGMIEAEVRRRSLQLADQLLHAGKEVLSIYADGILFVGDPILLPPGWEIEGRSERLYVLDDVSIIATDESEIVKLPGRSGAIRDELIRRYKEAGS